MKLKKVISAALAAFIIGGAFSGMGAVKRSSAQTYVKGLSTTSTTGSSVTTTSAGTTTTAKAASATTTTTTKKTTTTTTTTTATTTTTTTTVQQGKPVFQLSKTEVYHEKAGEAQEVTVSVAGANGLYCNTLIYVYFDKRMSISGAPVAGEALSGLTTGYAVGDTKDFIVLTSSGSADYGKDGVMWRISFDLPEDCKVGDVFTFGIGTSKYGEIPPLFTNSEYDEKGSALQEYIFANGSSDTGSIKVLENPPYKLGDVNNDLYIDAVDASMILGEYALLSSDQEGEFNERQQAAADVNHDGFIDAVDASGILAYYAHISSGGDGELEDFIKNMS